MAAKHLPGPWFVSRDPRPGMEWNNHIASVENPHLEVCWMFHTSDKDDNETGEANAALVAAAPELLEALQAFVTAAKSWHDFHHGSDTIACDWLCECIPAGEAALAKAAGQQVSSSKGE